MYEIIEKSLLSGSEGMVRASGCSLPGWSAAGGSRRSAARFSSWRRGSGPSALRHTCRPARTGTRGAEQTALPPPPQELLFLHIAFRHGSLHDGLVAAAVLAAAAAHACFASRCSPRLPSMPRACRAAPLSARGGLCLVQPEPRVAAGQPGAGRERQGGRGEPDCSQRCLLSGQEQRG